MHCSLFWVPCSSAFCRHERGGRYGKTGLAGAGRKRGRSPFDRSYSAHGSARDRSRSWSVDRDSRGSSDDSYGPSGRDARDRCDISSLLRFRSFWASRGRVGWTLVSVLYLSTHECRGAVADARLGLVDARLFFCISHHGSDTVLPRTKSILDHLLRILLDNPACASCRMFPPFDEARSWLITYSKYDARCLLPHATVHDLVERNS